MTHQAPPLSAYCRARSRPPGGAAARGAAAGRADRRPPRRAPGDDALDEAARISAAYDVALPVDPAPLRGARRGDRALGRRRASRRCSRLASERRTAAAAPPPSRARRLAACSRTRLASCGVASAARCPERRRLPLLPGGERPGHSLILDVALRVGDGDIVARGTASSSRFRISERTLPRPASGSLIQTRISWSIALSREGGHPDRRLRALRAPAARRWRPRASACARA